MSLRYLALGDSYTIGEQVGPGERWPAQLVALLRQEGLEVADAVIVARTGWTTDELMEAIDGSGVSGRFDLVSLLIGVNDQYRGGDLADYRKRFTALLDRAVLFAAGRASRVVVLSIPDWGTTPFADGRDRRAIALAIDRFNEVNHEVAVKTGAVYVDVTSNSRRPARGDTGPLLAPDGLHPSGAMYAEWARLVLPEAINALRKR